MLELRAGFVVRSCKMSSYVTAVVFVALVALEPRDLGWLQALGRARGRRDLLIMRGRLRGAPGFEVEVGDARGWTGRDGLRRLDPSAWERAEWGLAGGEVAHSSD